MGFTVEVAIIFSRSSVLTVVDIFLSGCFGVTGMGGINFVLLGTGVCLCVVCVKGKLVVCVFFNNGFQQ